MHVNNLMGEFGGTIIHDGESGETDEVYVAVRVVEDAVFSVLDRSTFDDGSTAGAKAAFLAATHAAGTIIYGGITAITVTTGLVEAYKSTRLGRG